MEMREKEFEEQMDTLHDKVMIMTEEFQERIRSLEEEIAEANNGAGDTICLRFTSFEGVRA